MRTLLLVSLLLASCGVPLDGIGVSEHAVCNWGDSVLVYHGGAVVSSLIYAVLTVRNGKLLRYQEFYDERAAHRAAGLSG